MKSHQFLAAVLVVCASSDIVCSERLHVPTFAPDIPHNFVSYIGDASTAIIQKARSYLPKLRGTTPALAFSSAHSSFPYLTDASDKDPLTVMRDFLESQRSFSPEEYIVKNSYTSSNGVTHIYLKQVFEGLEVENGDANFNIDKWGRLISYSETFYKGSLPASFAPSEGADQIVFGKQDTVTPTEAVLLLLDYLKLKRPESGLSVMEKSSVDTDPTLYIKGVPIALNDVAVVQRYLQVDDQLVAVWDVQLEMEENWYHAHVSAQGQVLGLVDWVSDASYEVYPLGVNDPEDGERKVLQNPADKDASPEGWHSQGKGKKFTTTIGNNVFAQENLDGKSNDDYMKHGRPDGGKTLSFEFPLDLNDEPKSYLKAAVTNLFYVNNVMHDLFYKYGFDEKSGNFQQNNWDKGGKGNDAVIANAQDGAGYNNANFATPPDGQHGKMRMYVWNTETPMRDGDLESGIIIHEYAHGISTRLTGGPANSGCLGFGEAGGMGEGWGDFWATILRTKPGYTRDTDLAMGSYAINKDGGIRKYVYSTSMETNPSTYGFIKRFDYFGVHAKGEVWAVTLYEMFWNLVDEHGFSNDWYNPEATDPSKNTGLPAGNIMALKLTVDGLKLQPCRPTFVDARDAILQSDEVNYEGKNRCLIWKAFAKRGLGEKARKGGAEDFTVPADCTE